MKKRKPARALPPGAMYVTTKGPVREPPAVPAKGAMYVTTRGPVTSLPVHKPGGRPRRADATAAAVSAEKKRRTKVGKPASHSALAKHFKVSPKTISRRLKKK